MDYRLLNNQGCWYKVLNMLTQEDLTAIGQVVDEKLKPIKVDMKKIYAHIKRIDRNINLIIDHFDKRIWIHDRRIDRIENHLEITPINSKK